MLYESLQSQPGVAHLNDLLRQQSENVFWTSKIWVFLEFCGVFLDFLIFLILDGFEGIWLSKSTPWLDFLPGATSKSIWAGIFIIFRFFCSYFVHVSILQVRELGRYCELRPRTWTKLKLTYPSFDVWSRFDIPMVSGGARTETRPKMTNFAR